jgi:hypothetical protein
MIYTKGLIIFAIFLLLACEKHVTEVTIDIDDSLVFIGNFKLASTFIQNDTVSLLIKDGKYVCSTRLPFGIGAGELKIENKSIEFIDTLFFIIPALYGPSYVLSGKYNYRYDGEYLAIQKVINDGQRIEYNLRLTQSN